MYVPQDSVWRKTKKFCKFSQKLNKAWLINSMSRIMNVAHVKRR